MPPLTKKILLGLGMLACLALATAVWQLSARADEVGTNDFRISDMGPDGNANYDAFWSPIAYNSTNDEYLVVWYGDDNTAPFVDEENEIFGQRLTFPVCGNGFVDIGEACDDGNADNTDACLGTCVSATCGDGNVEADVEECDDGGSNSDTTADACRATCVNASRGDGVTDTGEECDDGNLVAGDGCNDECGIEGTPVGGEIATDNADVDFGSLVVGETISLSAPDPRDLSALTIKGATLPDTCSCAWSVDPESIGTFSDSEACETELTLVAVGEGELEVAVDCGVNGSGTFLQSLTVEEPAPEEVPEDLPEEGTWKITGIGGCSLIY